MILIRLGFDQMDKHAPRVSFLGAYSKYIRVFLINPNLQKPQVLWIYHHPTIKDYDFHNDTKTPNMTLPSKPQTSKE